jgi:hypothetical protein
MCLSKFPQRPKTHPNPDSKPAEKNTRARHPTPAAKPPEKNQTRALTLYPIPNWARAGGGEQPAAGLVDFRVTTSDPGQISAQTRAGKTGAFITHRPRPRLPPSASAAGVEQPVSVAVPQLVPTLEQRERDCSHTRPPARARVGDR